MRTRAGSPGPARRWRARRTGRRPRARPGRHRTGTRRPVRRACLVRSRWQHEHQPDDAVGRERSRVQRGRGSHRHTARDEPGRVQRIGECQQITAEVLPGVVGRFETTAGVAVPARPTARRGAGTRAPRSRAARRATPARGSTRSRDPRTAACRVPSPTPRARRPEQRAWRDATSARRRIACGHGTCPSRLRHRREPRHRQGNRDRACPSGLRRCDPCPHGSRRRSARAQLDPEALRYVAVLPGSLDSTAELVRGRRAALPRRAGRPARPRLARRRGRTRRRRVGTRRRTREQRSVRRARPHGPRRRHARQRAARPPRSQRARPGRADQGGAAAACSSGARARSSTSRRAAAYEDPPAPAGQGGWGLGYAFSKGALHRIAGVLAVELGDRGVRAYNIQPGFIATERIQQDMGAFGFDAVDRARPRRWSAKVCRWLLESPDAGRTQRPVHPGSGAVQRARPPARLVAPGRRGRLTMTAAATRATSCSTRPRGCSPSGASTRCRSPRSCGRRASATRPRSTTTSAAATRSCRVARAPHPRHPAAPARTARSGTRRPVPTTVRVGGRGHRPTRHRVRATRVAGAGVPAIRQRARRNSSTGWHPTSRTLLRETSGYEAWDLLRDRCPAVPKDIWGERMSICTAFIGRAAADRAALLDRGGAHPVLSDDAIRRQPRRHGDRRDDRPGHRSVAQPLTRTREAATHGG